MHRAWAVDGTLDEEDAFEVWTACKMANTSLPRCCHDVCLSSGSAPRNGEKPEKKRDA